MQLIYRLSTNPSNDTSPNTFIVVAINVPEISKFLWNDTSPFTYKFSDISTLLFNDTSLPTVNLLLTFKFSDISTLLLMMHHHLLLNHFHIMFH